MQSNLSKRREPRKTSSPTGKIRVMIVEDSRVVREFLEYLIDRDPRLEVAASLDSAEEALRLLHRVSPDVISLDIRLPGMNGFQATQRIMNEKPTPIVVVSASVESEDLKITMNALRAGALSVLEKPVGITQADYESMAYRLCTQLAIMSQVKVVRQHADRGLRFMPGKTVETARPNVEKVVVPPGGFRMLGIVASTGGPSALRTLLGGLDSEFPLPIALVQHITSSFLDGFVSWLNSVSPLPITTANDGEAPLPGRIYVAPADQHLYVETGRLKLGHAEPVCSQRPSGTILLESVARTFGPQAIGVLLTGMGDDGATGLKAIHDAGGYTIAEHESTAVVYGMPAAAVRMGAAREILPLGAISPRLRQMVSKEEVR